MDPVDEPQGKWLRGFVAFHLPRQVLLRNSDLVRAFSWSTITRCSNNRHVIIGIRGFRSPDSWKA
ncbi:MAG: hypothetical protein WBW81_06970, partial [Methylocella sp.]